MMQSLPKELLVQILTFVATPSDLAHCAATCGALHSASNSPDLWKGMCECRFGKEVATDAIVEEYYGTTDAWKEMMRDDCRNAALPTIQWWNEVTGSYGGVACYWKYNDLFSRWYCCWVECMKWDRKNKQIKLYLDVRGEDDLRHPATSSICLKSDDKCVRWKGEWISELQDEVPGHFKGIFVIAESRFAILREFVKQGLFQFEYAYDDDDSFHVHDYWSTTLFGFSITDVGENDSSEQVLNHVFGIDKYSKGNKFSSRRAYFTSHVSPFANDAPEIERERWLKIFPADILDDTNRHSFREGSRDSRRSWWV